MSVTTPRRRAPLARAAVIAAFVLGALGITACDPPTPDQDAFYTPPSPLPSDPTTASLIPATPPTTEG